MENSWNIQIVQISNPQTGERACQSLLTSKTLQIIICEGVGKLESCCDSPGSEDFTRSKIPKNRTGLLRGLRMFENFEMVWGQKVFEETCHQPSDFWSTCVPRCSMALMSFFPDLVIGSASTSAASHARHQNCKRLRWLRRSKILRSRAPEPTPESQMHIRLWGNHKAAWHLRIRLRYMFKKGHSRQAKCLPSSNQIGVLIVFLPTVWLSQASLCHYSILCTKFEDKILTEII